ASNGYIVSCHYLLAKGQEARLLAEAKPERRPSGRRFKRPVRSPCGKRRDGGARNEIRPSCKGLAWRSSARWIRERTPPRISLEVATYTGHRHAAASSAAGPWMIWLTARKVQPQPQRKAVIMANRDSLYRAGAGILLADRRVGQSGPGRSPAN